MSSERDQAKAAVARILRSKGRERPAAVEWILDVLGGVEEGLRVKHPAAVLDYRSGFVTDAGRMYTFILTDTSGSFEQVLFRAFVTDHESSASFDFYEGEMKRASGRDEVEGAVLDYMTRESIVIQLGDLLAQFERIGNRRNGRRQ